MPQTVRFIHISDTHLGPDKDFELYGVNTYRAATALVEAINAVPAEASFVVHTGDVAARPDDRAYTLAVEVLSRLALPVYYVNGNHDRASMIRSLLPPEIRSLVPATMDRVSYRFEAGQHVFLVLDACGPAEIDPHGILARRSARSPCPGTRRGTGTADCLCAFSAPSHGFRLA